MIQREQSRALAMRIMGGYGDLASDACRCAEVASTTGSTDWKIGRMESVRGLIRFRLKAYQCQAVGPDRNPGAPRDIRSLS
jgi:hypothetical protein